MSLLSTYKTYTDTGLDWIGELPEHWTLIKGQFIFKVINERSKTGEELLLSVSEKKGVTPRSEADVTMFMAESYEGYKLCQPGDLVINSLWAWSNGLGFSEYHGIISTAYSVFRPNHKDYDYRYLHYLLKTGRYVGQYSIHSKGIWTSRLQLSDWSFLRLPIISPPKEEQTAIAKFLDRKTEEINRFIVLKERTIELLKERKAAIINQAITKGLNPNVEMKDSGIDWLGPIPKHWQAKKLKWSCSLLRDGTHLPPPRVDEGYPLLSVRNIINEELIFREDDTKISANDYRVLSRSFVPQKNDIVLAIVGGTIGKVAIIKEMALFHIQRSLAIFRTNPKVVRHRFLFYFFKSSLFQDLLWNNVGFSAQPGIYLGALSDFATSIPPVDEQKEIEYFLDSELKPFDVAIHQAETEIEIIERYHESLISESVTGKIDVRNKALVHG